MTPSTCPRPSGVQLPAQLPHQFAEVRGILFHDAPAVINVGNDSGQLPRMSKQAKEVLEADKLEAVADRGYFDGEEILSCEQAGVAVTLPKPMTSNAKAEGRFGKQDFAYL